MPRGSDLAKIHLTMLQANTRDELVGLFNRLADLQGDQVAEIGRIVWRLRPLSGAGPGREEAKVALIRAHMILGEASEAGRLAENVFDARQQLDPAFAPTFGAQLLELGYYDKFLALADEMVRPSPEYTSKEAAVMRSKAYWGLGRLENIERSIEELAGSDGLFSARAWLQEMAKRGLGPYFADHQRIVANHARGWQVFADVSFMGNSEGGAEATSLLYGAGTYAERRAREDALAAELGSFYQNIGEPDLPFARLLGTTFLPVLARPDLRGRLAAA